MKIDVAVRNRILELCAAKNITINKPGTICGITQSTLKNIASGRNGATVLTIKKICGGSDITIVDIFSTNEFK